MQSVEVHTSCSRCQSQAQWFAPASVAGSGGKILAVPAQTRRCRAVKSLGKDATDGWMDLLKHVSSSGGPKSAFQDLAYDIGRDVYMDMNGWHLFLRDVNAGHGLKLNQALAQQLGVEAGKLQEQSQLESLLKKVPVKLGGGKLQVSLYDVLPSSAVQDLQRIVEDFARNG
ncbi:hypothetical protein WJX84_005949 [Apatococcus fuscideae]|uniref:Uncharacterized protein n=1 Tax=Apatococcus fuscideae TaxID=2026836 RepID=A0AAW1SX63_9CHLO